jgi:DNA polymerase III alpha subunit
MKPECFCDVVIEVAIIRPGPIEGDMVHPISRALDANHPYFDVTSGACLKRTLGVPLFREMLRSQW